MITIYNSNNETDDVIVAEMEIPEWKIVLNRQLYQCIKMEYTSEILLKFEHVKNINVLCKQIAKSVLNSMYEEEILEAIATCFNVDNVLELDADSKIKMSKKLKNCFLEDELEFLRDEVNDSISRIKKEWLNI